MNNHPQHIAVITDGNRRWAEKKGRDRTYGHIMGAEKIKEIAAWLPEFEYIKHITFYSLSIENLQNRSKFEIDVLMKLCEKEFKDVKNNPDIKNNGIKVNVFGDLDMLPENARTAIDDAMEATKKYDNHQINFAIAYSGQQDIVHACKKICEETIEGKLDINNIDKQTVIQHLWFPYEPEILIRTGGENRLSNFLLSNIPYTELFFLDVLWPDFSKELLHGIVNEYVAKRERKFGGDSKK